MNLNTLKYFTVLLLTICSLNAFESYGQETIKLNPLSTNNPNTKLKLKTEKDYSVFSFGKKTSRKYNTVNHTSNNLKHFPFGFGINVGIGMDFKQKLITPGIIGNFNINLSERIFFFQLEYGSFFESDLETNTSYLSLGLKFKFFKSKKNNLYLHPAIFGTWNKSGGGGIGGGFSGFLAINYLYSTTDYFGIGVSLKYPFGSFRNILLTIGFQLLTN